MDGSSSKVTLTVGDEDTAIALGSGDVAVLATPRVLALAEEAAVAAIADHLRDDETSVGIHADLHHVKATKVGGSVCAVATVVETAGRSVTFELKVTEGDETVAYGSHKRVVVPRERFDS